MEHKELLHYLVENTARNKQLKFGKENVLSVSGEYGIVNQIAFQGRSFAGESVADYHVVETDDIVYTKSPLKANPYGIIKVNNGVPGIVSTLYAVYHPLKTVVPRFVDFYFSNNLRINKFLKPLVNIGAKHDMKVNNTFVLTGTVVFPPLREQQKIVDFLTVLDRRIDIQRKKVEALKKYKRGVFETVFSQKVRLIPRNKRKDWQKYKLSDFATRVTRKNGGQSDIPLTISAQYGLIDQRDFFSKTVASADMSGYYLLRSGEYAYNRSTSNDYPFGSIKRLELYPILLFVTASSIPLVSAENGENSLIPLRLLFPPNPLRWASAGDLFSSTNRPTCLRYAEGASHMARENPLQSGFKSHSHKRPTFAFMGESGYTLGFRRKIAHKGSHGETRGVLDGGGITTLGAFCTVMNCGCPPRAG